MKRVIYIISAFILLCGMLTVSSFAANKTYPIKDWGVTIEIPEGYEVLTRDTIEEKSVLGSEKDISDFEILNEEGIDLWAYSYKEDKEIGVLTAVTDLQDYHLFTDRELNELINSDYWKFPDTDELILEPSFYRTKQATFLKMSGRVRLAEKDSSFEIYMTVRDGKAISIYIMAGNHNMTTAEKEEAQAIADGLKFAAGPVSTPEEQKEAQKTYPIKEWGVSMEIPEGYEVFTRDIIDEAGTSASDEDVEFVEMLNDADIYLWAYNNEENKEIEVLICETDDQDCHLFTDEELAVLAKEGDWELTNHGEVLFERTFYRTDEAAFLKVSGNLNPTESDTSFVRYMTARDGKAIAICIEAENHNMTLAEREELQAIADGLKFDSGPISASEEQDEVNATYSLADWGVSLDVPKSYDIFCRNIYGEIECSTDKEDFFDGYVNDPTTKFYAKSPDGDKEIVVSIYEPYDEDYHLMNDDDLQAILEAESEALASVGSVVLETGIYRTQNATFIRMSGNARPTVMDRSLVYYLTVREGKEILITVMTPYRYMTLEEREATTKVADSLRFDSGPITSSEEQELMWERPNLNEPAIFIYVTGAVVLAALLLKRKVSKEKESLHDAAAAAANAAKEQSDDTDPGEGNV